MGTGGFSCIGNTLRFNSLKDRLMFLLNLSHHLRRLGCSILSCNTNEASNATFQKIGKGYEILVLTRTDNCAMKIDVLLNT